MENPPTLQIGGKPPNFLACSPPSLTWWRRPWLRSKLVRCKGGMPAIIKLWIEVEVRKFQRNKVDLGIAPDQLSSLQVYRRLELE